MNELVVQNLVKQYEGRALLAKNRTKKRALAGVSFSLSSGLYGLLGPNGAGKSTLINIITGSMRPSKGKVLWNGKSITGLDKKYRAILGYMPQQQTLYDSFSGRRFCAIWRRSRKSLKKIRSARFYMWQGLYI